MSTRGHPRVPDRGQTLPDFIVGIAIFLLVVAFLVGFIPQMTAPYADQEHAAVADRIGADVAGALLAEEGAPSGLDEGCAESFFVAQVDPEGCGFDEGTLHERLGVKERYRVNVTVSDPVSDEGEPAILCASDGSITHCEDSEDRLATGPETPSAGTAVATTRRTMHVDGEEVLLTVRVWEP